ncbi:hypothetical protein [Enterococcus sp. DIV1420a]|uniref:hypothetical protein n=1 Tax=Enterococcus sp. DIV1420a TaxID=2774672 RepID=UPI003F2484CA
MGNCLEKLVKEAKISVTVITNGTILMNCSIINLIILGRTLHSKSNALVGNITTELIKKYVINKAFISCSGLSMPVGPTDTNEQESKISGNSFLASEQNFLLADNTKFDFKTVYLNSSFDSLDYIVTNERASKEWKEFLTEKK